MERSHGEEGVDGKCRKDKSHVLWYRPGPLAELRRIPMRCLSYRSRQRQHLLQWLQTLMADHRVKSRSDLISWRW